MKSLIESIGMKVLMGPYAVYSNDVGNRGLTAIAVLNTSHAAIHVWDEVSPALLQFDLYSCGHFELDDIYEKLKPFGLVKFEYDLSDREHELKELKTGFQFPLDV